MKGFGQTTWGVSPWATSEADRFEVVSATPLSPNKVSVLFSKAFLLDAVVKSASTYAISGGVRVLGVEVTSDTSVALHTSKTTYSTLYTLSVVGPVVSQQAGVLEGNTATFTGPDSTLAFTVSNLQARSMCIGQAIRLTWNNPVGTRTVKILRTTKAWPLDLSDPHDVVYYGEPIESFEDTGVLGAGGTIENVNHANRKLALAPSTLPPWGSNTGLPFIWDTPVVAEDMLGKRESVTALMCVDDVFTLLVNEPTPMSVFHVGQRVRAASPLAPQTYYYYTVLVSTTEFSVSFQADSPGVFDFTDDCRAYALSIDKSLSSTGWFKVPRDLARLDSLPEEQGGSDGFLAKWLDVMGCWLNLMRGHSKALTLLTNDNEAPFPSLEYKLAAIGATTEGASYDLEVQRRAAIALSRAYRKRGTCPGFVEVAKIYGKWDVECVGLGDSTSRSGASNLRTWDGESISERSSRLFSDVVQSFAARTLQFVGRNWDANAWAGGALRGCMGEVLDVVSSTADTLTVKALDALTTLAANAAAGSSSLSLVSAAWLTPGIRLQLNKADASAGELVTVASIGGNGAVTLASPLVGSYVAGDIVAVGSTILRGEILLTGTSPMSNVLIVTGQKWVIDQWIGYKVLDAANNLRTVTGNGVSTLFLDGAVAAGVFALAKGFNGSTFVARAPVLQYHLVGGEHSFLFDPIRDFGLRGTQLDPFYYLWQGEGSAIQGSWGRNDVGIYVKTQVTITKGRFQGTSSPSVIDLDPASPALVPGSLVGAMFNPNQNQERMFEIVSNTANTLTVAGDVTGIAVPGQFYYALSARDSSKFQRVAARLREFASEGTRPHILFV